MPEDREQERPLPPGIMRSREIDIPSTERSAASPFVPVRKARTDTGSSSRITAIEQQHKRVGRVSIYVDGKFVLGLFEDVAASLGLKVGKTITPEELEEASRAETLRKALEDAYNLLSYRDRAEKEISDRLARKGYEQEIINSTLEKLRAAGYLNDASFARRWAASRGQTRGRMALARELSQKGVDRETASEALEEIQDTDADQAAARTVAIRRVGERPTDRSREARAKLAAFLQRRGFSWDIVRPVLTELYGVRDGEEEDTETEDE